MLVCHFHELHTGRSVERLFCLSALFIYLCINVKHSAISYQEKNRTMEFFVFPLFFFFLFLPRIKFKSNHDGWHDKKKERRILRVRPVFKNQIRALYLIIRDPLQWTSWVVQDLTRAHRSEAFAIGVLSTLVSSWKKKERWLNQPTQRRRRRKKCCCYS